MFAAVARSAVPHQLAVRAREADSAMAWGSYPAVLTAVAQQACALETPVRARMAVAAAASRKAVGTPVAHWTAAWSLSVRAAAAHFALGLPQAVLAAIARDTEISLHVQPMEAPSRDLSSHGSQLISPLLPVLSSHGFHLRSPLSPHRLRPPVPAPGLRPIQIVDEKNMNGPQTVLARDLLPFLSAQIHLRLGRWQVLHLELLQRRNLLQDASCVRLQVLVLDPPEAPIQDRGNRDALDLPIGHPLPNKIPAGHMEGTLLRDMPRADGPRSPCIAPKQRANILLLSQHVAVPLDVQPVKGVFAWASICHLPQNAAQVLGQRPLSGSAPISDARR
eukprot:CAMPEP_0181405616 /NCGR_PEP_ID=MMETSP1110-20121109/4849_1 /TAXON_ID=174948 /ORGANISM="Symbiodinium sp., Strain CCMP421" /LENGTH=333 /DNA_ID=CAMNT_0023528005 /DNA_START=663 /DNA_END=1661 /DNA_ORIENTATION=+